MAVFIKTAIFYWVVYQQLLLVEATAGQEAKNGVFIAKLFNGYSKHMLPVCNFDRPVQVNLSMYLVSLDHLDMKQKTVSAEIILELQWTDENLKWNVSNFKNLSRFAFEAKSVWLPDLEVGNFLGMLTFIKADDVKSVIINNDGVVEAWPYLNVDLGVDMNINKYPFDTQDINFELMSWVHDDSELVIGEFDNDLERNNPLKFYRQSGEWDLINWKRVNYQVSYDNFTHTFTIVRYKFTIKRRWLYTIINLFLPVMLTSLINTLSFLLPVDCGERISLSNTVFLTLAVFFSIVNDSLPKTTDGLPIIIAYIGFQMVGSALTIGFTIWSVALYHSGDALNNSKIFQRLFSRKKQRSSLTEKGLNSDIRDIPDSSNIEKKDNFGKEASRYLDKICFWFFLLLNIAILSTVFITTQTE